MGKLSRRSIVLAALCVGLLAALLAYLFLNQKGAEAAKATTPVPVVVASQDIPASTVIEPGMVRESTQPLASVPANSAASVGEVLGRVTMSEVKQDEPVQRGAIATRSAALGLAYVVPEGMRAVTVGLDPIIGVAGFLKAGDHVDVLATFEVDKLAVTRTVLQDVELLAIGPEVVPTDKSASGKDAKAKEQPNATLSLNPEDAEKLILAESQGKLRLTLRSRGDDARMTLAGVRSDNLIGLRAGSTAVAAASRPSARVMSTGYVSPAWAGGYPSFPRFGQTQPVSIGDRPRIAADELDKSVSVETVRGTQKTTVDVRSE